MKTRPLPPWPRRKALREWLNSLRDDLESVWPRPSHNIRVNQTSRGTSYVGVPKTEDAEGTFRGEWDASFGTAYDAQDMVKVSNGQEAGTYVAIENIRAGDVTKAPWTGDGWVLIARVNDQSSWL